MILSTKPSIGEILKSSVLTRRDLKHFWNGFGLYWHMCRDRHPSISRFGLDLGPKLAKLEVKCVAMRGSVLVRGFDSNPFRPIWCPGGRFRAIFRFLRCPPWVPIIVPILSLFPCCGCAVLCTLFCPAVYVAAIHVAT